MESNTDHLSKSKILKVGSTVQSKLDFTKKNISQGIVEIYLSFFFLMSFIDITPITKPIYFTLLKF